MNPYTRNRALLTAVLLLFAGRSDGQERTPPPEPIMPIPTARQLDWQRGGMRMFLHFGVNTFSNREWGTGQEDPDSFSPTEFDARQWARVARETGFTTVILTAKHHDGFALWNSAYSDHDVGSSSWMGGRGDVVAALAEAAREEGLQLGLYLSPWDMHEPAYGDEAAYNAFYLGQLRELLTQYGPVTEIWFDGARGPEAKDMEYHFDTFRALVRQLQPRAVMFSDEGPDIRWIGNERGFAGETNWSTMDRSAVSIGQSGIGDYLNSGELGGPDWVPGECDVSVRPGWFYHPDQDPRSLDDLMEIYYRSVGRNCVLLLNVPPDPRGLLSEKDVERLTEFQAARDAAFSVDLAEGARATATNIRASDSAYETTGLFDNDPDTYWATDDSVRLAMLEIELAEARSFNVVRLQEPIQLGQRIKAYRIDALVGDRWQPVSEGTTIGHQKLDTFDTITSRRIRITILDARASPLLSGFGLYRDPRW